jgi:hypothetical protein
MFRPSSFIDVISSVLFVIIAVFPGSLNLYLNSDFSSSSCFNKSFLIQF